ncbi:hypothetical protein IMG5_168630 [Ichthyophthirius multifiliis]|uniref:Probable threonine--tRNA ligase, cytoplasmic n=1 Tax=Ichthyophthirius multifiliis TaxID=5932 RepID=G0R160_ICHMU|nr:hypothetical protein IMG5_168630 [Ichthyophthirius multifiliis]EGR28827.1 hypothetical protein IMG5_168630 [Ichthyophthirius multifiliis]|eukprot:XP_004030063.1 hypothetical protein IMG5_168630 [Ichthyophthirius multifiliis]
MKNIQYKIKQIYNGKILTGNAFCTTPLEIARKISKNISEKALVAKVQYSRKYPNVLTQGLLINPEEELHSECCFHDHDKYELIDLNSYFEGDCKLELFTFEEKEGQQVFWHSTAHILGLSLEELYPNALLCTGPAVKDGFFYDFYVDDPQFKLTPEEYPKLEQIAQKAIKEKHIFERIFLNKNECKELFKENTFKLKLIKEKIPENGYASVYKCGNLIDLCTGPHIPNSGYIKAFKLQKNSSSYWLSDKKNQSLQRVYGISFPKESLLTEFLKREQEKAQRDHRNIGKNQNLFNFNGYAAGSAFFFPQGAHIYNKIMETLRKQYKLRNYQEVITPNLYNCDLWKISGHWDKYKENMFVIKNDDEVLGLKPMNCPGHCLMFSSIQRSYKELPLRFADFGVLHRNEIQGSLSGLTRVRRFQQDDGHIFCTLEQIQDEIFDFLDFLDFFYSLFGFQYSLALSTRPENYIGSEEIWEQAEKQLVLALEKFNKPFIIKQKDGAFYGPKIDVSLHDTHDRNFQCGTVQLDFNLPERFNLQYRAQDTSIQEKGLKQGFLRPVILHRAVIGSFERFLGILCEQNAGKWPFWISPFQFVVISVDKSGEDYAKNIFQIIQKEGFEAQVDVSDDSLGKKVRNWHHFNYIGVVGKEEIQKGEIDIRSRDGIRLGKFTIKNLIIFLKKENEIPISKYEEKLEQKINTYSFQNEDESFLNNINEELLNKNFFNNDGYTKGPKDDEIYEKLQKLAFFEPQKYINIKRWLKYYKKSN